ncbi:GntR family transcriptional regulator [Streptomyces sp. NPDC048650]|uniref:GntR family transcriptional regulator n=1 Tax=unclassified Streptomyces TaxID=2593676 RepID=UPI00371408B5
MIEFAPDRPRWRQVADVMRERIADGTYPPGTQIPSVLKLQEEFGIATATSQKVHRGLRDEGLIYTEPGLGSFVAKRQPGGPVSAAKWVQIANVIRKRIVSGEYPTHHLISEVRMEQEFGVARVTVRKVTAALREEGLIVTTPGMGSFVTPRRPRGSAGSR